METSVVHKSFPSEVKVLGDGTYEFTISTEGMDRDGDIVRARGWDFTNYLKNPVVLYGHDYKGLPIGKATSLRVEGTDTIATVQFSEAHQLARDVKALVDEGVLRTTSVGFIPTAEPKSLDKGYEFAEQELLEFSMTPVPSNPDALRRAMAKGLISEETAKTLEPAIVGEAVVKITLDTTEFDAQLGALMKAVPGSSPVDPVDGAMEAAARGDLGPVKTLVTDLTSQVAQAVDAAARALKLADEAEARATKNLGQPSDAPAEQPGSSETSAAKSVLSTEDIARAAAAAAKDYFEREVLGRVS